MVSASPPVALNACADNPESIDTHRVHKTSDQPHGIAHSRRNPGLYSDPAWFCRNALVGLRTRHALSGAVRHCSGRGHAAPAASAPMALGNGFWTIRLHQPGHHRASILERSFTPAILQQSSTHPARLAGQRKCGQSRAGAHSASDQRTSS